MVSDEVVTEHFVCDLEKCKGGCCVEGDCGAPLTNSEVAILQEEYNNFLPYLNPQFVREIDKQGIYVQDAKHGNVTPTINGGICVYGLIEPGGVVMCGIEKAWREGKTTFRKPISCHLYPIRVANSGGWEMLNYEPRKELCRAACKLGNRLKIPVYRFLKDALIRQYGDEFYEALEAAEIAFRKGEIS